MFKRNKKEDNTLEDITIEIVNRNAEKKQNKNKKKGKVLNFAKKGDK